jgi:hypothetical protein
MSSEEASIVKKFLETVELLYAWKEGDLMAIDEEENRRLGQPIDEDPLREAVRQIGDQPSPLETVLMKREQYEQQTRE